MVTRNIVSKFSLGVILFVFVCGAGVGDDFIYANSVNVIVPFYNYSISFCGGFSKLTMDVLE